MEENVDLQNVIKQAYSCIVNEKMSLREVSNIVGIERKKLKKLMETNLSQEELEKLKYRLGVNNNQKRDGKRHKKAKALNGKPYQDAIEALAQRQIKPEWLEEIYQRCQERPQSKITKDTLAIKLVELLEYFETRNQDITQNRSGYISAEDVIEMIKRNPRLITSDLENNIIPKCTMITKKNDEDIELANEKIKSNPGIFRKSIKTIKEGR